MNKFQTWMALNAPWFALHKDAGVEPLMDVIRRIAIQFFDRAVDHWNLLGSASQDYDPRIRCRYPRQPSPSRFVEDADSLEPKED
ncbi:hypothetical protein Trydic_g17084 [Trypoxylus dichotomus]